jgi:hypothetical protein
MPVTFRPSGLDRCPGRQGDERGAVRLTLKIGGGGERFLFLRH